MDPAGYKRQKLGNEHASSSEIQSQSNILLHNRRLRLLLREKFNELNTESATKDLKAINNKRREIIGIIERLQQVPIQQLYASAVPTSSDPTLHEFGLIGSNCSSEIVINLDEDKDNVKYHTPTNVGNIEADSTVDYDDKNRVKSCGDESSSSNEKLIMLDNCNSSTEPHDLFKQAKESMDTDNVSVEVRSACHQNTYYFLICKI